MTSATDNRTTELREKLTERGVDYIGDIASRDGVRTTHWKNDCNIVFQAIDFGMDNLLIQVVLTPDQAIAATLGNDQELINLAHNAWSMALCAMNGMPIPAEWGDAVERGLREHGIDVDGELAAFEVIDDER